MQQRAERHGQEDGQAPQIDAAGVALDQPVIEGGDRPVGQPADDDEDDLGAVVSGLAGAAGRLDGHDPEAAQEEDDDHLGPIRPPGEIGEIIPPDRGRRPLIVKVLGHAGGNPD